MQFRRRAARLLPTGMVSMVLALPVLFAGEARAQGLEFNIDRPGQDYTSFDLATPDPALCQQACDADAQCVAFTYVNPGVQGASARCWLKNSVPQQVASDCCISGVKGGGASADELWRRTATEHRGNIGQRIAYSCPPIAAIPAVTIWGTGLYTDDSAVCVAAVHAGVISAAGATVTIEIAAGQSSYPASTQNGVASSSYGSWPGSYTIVGVGGMPGAGTGGGSGGMPGTGSSGGGGALPPAADFVDSLGQDCEGGTGTQCTFACPAGMTLGTRVWGTGIYTDDSNICLAAVHAGVISQAGGGWVTIVIADGQTSYTGSTQNGVSSTEWGSWTRSFIFAGASPGGGIGGQNAGGPCADPRMQQVMDEWLARAVPTAEGNLRYEQWGRAVGTTPSAVLSAPNPPDTHLSRCEYLLQQAPGLPSRNIGTLYEYLQKNGLI